MKTKKLGHPGNVLLAGFGFMLLMMGILVYFSVKQDIPLVSRQYYEQELVYQQKIDARNNAAAYGEAFHAEITGDELVLSVPPQLAPHLQNGVAFFYCAAKENMDRKIAIAPRYDGRYFFERKRFPGRGYQLQLSFTADGKSYYKEFILPW